MITAKEAILTAEEIRLHFKDNPAEQEVLQLLCNGKIPKEIADERNVSIFTVRHQVDSIHKVLNQTTTPACIVRGLQVGVISLPEKDV